MYLSSWSGGKDSCLAYYKALKSGYKITSLVNFISREHKKVRSHEIPSELIKIQADLLDVPLCQKETSHDDYEYAFKDTVKSFKPSGIKGIIFGDIYIDEHKEWVQRVCSALEIKAIEPLWEQKTEHLINEFIEKGFKAIIVSANANLIDEKWIGEYVDSDFINYLKTKPDVDICGEKGEYHTFVVAGPIFNGRIAIKEKSVIKKDDYWVLDIKDYTIEK